MDSHQNHPKLVLIRLREPPMRFQLFAIISLRGGAFNSKIVSQQTNKNYKAKSGQIPSHFRAEVNVFPARRRTAPCSTAWAALAFAKANTVVAAAKRGPRGYFAK